MLTDGGWARALPPWPRGRGSPAAAAPPGGGTAAEGALPAPGLGERWALREGAGPCDSGGWHFSRRRRAHLRQQRRPLRHRRRLRVSGRLLPAALGVSLQVNGEGVRNEGALLLQGHTGLLHGVWGEEDSFHLGHPASVHHRLNDARVSRGDQLGSAPLQDPAKHVFHGVRIAPGQDTPLAVEGIHQVLWAIHRWTSPRPVRSPLGARGGREGKGGWGGGRRGLPIVSGGRTRPGRPPTLGPPAPRLLSVQAKARAGRGRAGSSVRGGGANLRVSLVSEAGLHALSQKRRSRVKGREPESGKQENGA